MFIRQENFIHKAKIEHGNYFNYDKVIYINQYVPVIIKCPIHGEFKQEPSAHLNHGCKYCSYDKKKITQARFLKQVHELYKDKYDLKNTTIRDTKSIINLVCKEHGPFNVMVDDFLTGTHCKKCVLIEKLEKKRKLYGSDIIHRFQKVHGNIYDYKNVNYILADIPVIIMCAVHGNFLQKPSNHLLGQGCPTCALQKSKEPRLSLEEVKNKFKCVHINRYNYDKVNYIGCEKYVEIICKKHGSFWQTPNNHTLGHGCPKCGHTISKQQTVIVDWLKSLGVTKIELSTRKIIKPLELDIYLPDQKLAFEFDGLYWHSENNEYVKCDKYYHLTKTKECEKQNIQLIHIFEDEWVNKQEIVKSIIKSKLGLTEHRLYARDCEIREVNKSDATLFLNTNHLQGSKTGKNFGLYHNNELIQLISLGKSRYNKKYEYELLRSCTKINTSVIGGFSRLIKHVTKILNIKSMISYVDRRYFNGKGYTDWKLVGSTDPNYYYLSSAYAIRESRLTYQKHKLKTLFKEHFDPNLTEWQIMQLGGYDRIYDCGNLVYEWIG